MKKQSISILKLDHEDIKGFFLKQESYVSFDLPPYFDFTSLLNNLSKKIEKVEFNSLIKTGEKPKDYEAVNYKFLSSKDGKYDWRPLEIIHPAIYVTLVNIISKEENWKLIVDKMNELFDTSYIECESIPVKALVSKKDLALQIEHWLEEVERKSLELSLEYKYSYSTDIVNCYGSLYTHLIPRSLHGLKRARKVVNSDVGNKIDFIIRSMCYGQTNGIPQGSILMDFIAEIVLAYIDNLITQELQKTTLEKEDFKIIRYRDDYRIFVKRKDDGEIIIKTISHIVGKCGMKLNSSKTTNSDELIKSTFKEDKWFVNTNLHMKVDIKTSLMQIYELSLKFPNSGALLNYLDKFQKKLYNYVVEEQKLDKQYLISTISIVTEITVRNPRTYAIGMAILSILINQIDTKKQQEEVLSKILLKYESSLNIDLQSIWLQRLYLGCNITFPAKVNIPLCQRVDNPDEILWESKWLEEKYLKVIQGTEIIDQNKLDELDRYIQREEFELFEYKS
jgi:hypothetical protein